MNLLQFSAMQFLIMGCLEGRKCAGNEMAKVGLINGVEKWVGEFLSKIGGVGID